MPVQRQGWTDPTAAQSDLDRYRRKSDNALGTQAPTTAYDPRDSDEQRNATGLARDAALGNAPSAAQIQMKQGTEQAIAGQMAAAASATGGARAQAAAQHQAAAQGAALSQQNVANTAALRANEMAQARQAYIGAAGQQRQQGAQETQFMTDAELRQRGMNYGRESAYLGAETALRQGQTQATMKEWEIEQQQNQARKEQETGIISGVVGAAGAAAGMMASDVRAKGDISIAGYDDDPWDTRPANSASVQNANASKMSRWQDKAKGWQSQQAQDEAAKANESKMYQQGGQRIAQGLAPAATAAFQAMSDERTKTNRGSRELDGLLDALGDSASTYKYKDPVNEPTDEPTGGRYAGVMAQRLEDVPGLGTQLVKETPRGKAIEGRAMLSALAAGMGRQQQEIDDLKKRRARHG